MPWMWTKYRKVNKDFLEKERSYSLLFLPGQNRARNYFYLNKKELSSSRNYAATGSSAMEADTLRRCSKLGP